jgi:phosphoenolpyruvate phosphomutase
MKDTQKDPDFCVVARVEAFIAGWPLEEALKRAEAYRKSGAGNIYCDCIDFRCDINAF